LPADKKFAIAGREFTLAPFTIEFAEDVIDRVDAMAKLEKSSEQTSAMVDIVVAALSGSNTDVSVEWIRKNVCVGDLPVLYTAIMKSGGTRTVPSGEGESP
jgi:hypothetical protein